MHRKNIDQKPLEGFIARESQEMGQWWEDVGCRDKYFLMGANMACSNADWELSSRKVHM